MDFINVVENIVKTQTLYHSVLEGNEAQTRWMLIDPFILDGLGYTRNDIIVEFNIDVEDRVNKYNKLDYCILVKNMPRILVEAKSLGINLYEKKNQLKDYFNYVLSKYDYTLRGLIGVLTDGDLYLFYTNSVYKDEMDNIPFYTIRLSTSEDSERLKLLEYKKDNISNLDNYNLLLTDEEYDLTSPYRIDIIESVFNYYSSMNIDLKIENIYLRGKRKNITSFRTIYRMILKDIDVLKPGFLYDVARKEDMDSNGIIDSKNFSCFKINNSCIEYQTKFGLIYISIPSNRAMLIDRIVYLAETSGYGKHNILITLGKKEKRE